jgi:Prion-inhibition and propagation
MPAEFRYMRTRLKTEQYRLANWAVVAGLSSERCEDELSDTLKHNRLMLNDVLHEIKCLLDCFGKIDDRYGMLVEGGKAEKEVETEGDLEAFRHLFPATKALLKATKRSTLHSAKKLRWAQFDGEKFERCLDRLTKWNDFLANMMDSHQKDKLLNTTQETNMQILQLHNKFDDMLRLIKATTLTNLVVDTVTQHHLSSIQQRLGPAVRPSQSTHEQVTGSISLIDLTRFKARALAVNEGVSEEDFEKLELEQPYSIVKDPKLEPKLFKLLDSDLNGHENIIRSEATYDGEHVFVEWKQYEPWGRK